jgi:hypothetical protein
MDETKDETTSVLATRQTCRLRLPVNQVGLRPGNGMWALGLPQDGRGAGIPLFWDSPASYAILRSSCSRGSPEARVFIESLGIALPYKVIHAHLRMACTLAYRC